MTRLIKMTSARVHAERGVISGVCSLHARRARVAGLNWHAQQCPVHARELFQLITHIVSHQQRTQQSTHGQCEHLMAGKRFPASASVTQMCAWSGEREGGVGVVWCVSALALLSYFCNIYCNFPMTFNYKRNRREEGTA